MRQFQDIETNEIICLTQLKDEYIQLFADGETETKTFADYLKNCMYYNNGTLIEITK